MENKAMYATEARQTQVSEQRGELLDLAQQQSKLISELQGRIGPVRRDDAPEAVKADSRAGLPDTYRVSHAQKLHDIADKFRQHNDWLMSLYQRVEI